MWDTPSVYYIVVEALRAGNKYTAHTAARKLQDLDSEGALPSDLQQVTAWHLRRESNIGKSLGARQEDGDKPEIDLAIEVVRCCALLCVRRSRDPGLLKPSKS
jgi:hypothetical protein